MRHWNLPARFLRLTRHPPFSNSRPHVQKQFENLSRQTQQLTGLTKRAIIETTQSWQSAAKSMDER